MGQARERARRCTVLWVAGLSLLAATAVLAVLVGTPRTAHACSCAPRSPLSEYADDVDVAFAGRQVGSFLDEDDRYMRILVFEVDRVYKGRVGPVVEVRTLRGGGAVCGVDFGGLGSVGIAERRSRNGDIFVSLCGGYVTVGELEDVFGAGYPPDHTPSMDALGGEFPGVFDGTGCGQGLCPQEPLRRWEMAVWLVRVLDRTNPTGQATPRFDDVDIDVWWAPYAHRLAELEATKGCDHRDLLPRQGGYPSSDGHVFGAGSQPRNRTRGWVR